MAKTKVLITVKTYPTISTKYEELVCTAGFREDGSWVRIYPVQFRKKAYKEQYKKYQWIEIDLVKNEKDFRPETFRPVTHETEISIVNQIRPDGDAWFERRKVVLNKVYSDITELITEAKNKEICTSLAVFKPTIIKDFIWEEDEREWSEAKLAVLKQYNLYETISDVVKKLPYKFSYIFMDIHGLQSKLMIEDWETGALYWNVLAKYGDEKKACEEVRHKYFDDFAKTKDLHFFLGTTLTHPLVCKNPLVIIGTFHPARITQGRLEI